MDLGLKDKVAIVAASSRGIGRATAHRLAREGADVTICARGQEDLEQTLSELAEYPGETLAVQADVTEPEDLDTLVEDTRNHLGTPDILVNNAGGPPSGGFLDTHPKEFEDAVQLNLMSMVRLTKRVLPDMREQQWGRVINITSVSAKQPIPDLVLSNSTRAGVLGTAKTLAGEVAEDNVTVNSVLPGLTGTDRMKELTEDQADREGIDYETAREESASKAPMGRWGEPEELADAIAFLASERASFITGTALPVDGGLVQSLY